jgi:hypothetical protein
MKMEAANFLFISRIFYQGIQKIVTEIIRENLLRFNLDSNIN